MKLIDKMGDSIDKKAFKMEKVVRIPYEQMAEMIKKEYVTGADDEFLKKISKTIKGGKFRARKLKSASGRYILIGTFKRLISISGKRVAICIADCEEKVLYKPEKNLKFSRKLRKAVKAYIEEEKVNKNK